MLSRSKAGYGKHRSSKLCPFLQVAGDVAVGVPRTRLGVRCQVAVTAERMMLAPLHPPPQDPLPSSPTFPWSAYQNSDPPARAFLLREPFHQPRLCVPSWPAPYTPPAPTQIPPSSRHPLPPPTPMREASFPSKTQRMMGGTTGVGTGRILSWTRMDPRRGRGR